MKLDPKLQRAVDALRTNEDFKLVVEELRFRRDDLAHKLVYLNDAEALRVAQGMCRAFNTVIEFLTNEDTQ